MMDLGKKKKKKKLKTADAHALSSFTASPFGNFPWVSVDILHANEWNPNVVAKEDMVKLKTNIKDTLEATGEGDIKKGTIPPIVVREHPSKDGEYEIIDGYHRTEVMKKLGFDKVPFCNMGKISKKHAMRLTETLNHLRGTNDPVKYVAYLEEYQRESGDTLEDMENYMPDSAEDMEALMRAQNVKLDDVQIHSSEEDEDGDDSNKDEDDDKWVELKFRVPVAVAEIVESELGRIGSVLEGKRIRDRALEFMAVNSADTPLESITGRSADGEDNSTKLAKKKVAMVKKHRPTVEVGEGN